MVRMNGSPLLIVEAKDASNAGRWLVTIRGATVPFSEGDVVPSEVTHWQIKALNLDVRPADAAALWSSVYASEDLEQEEVTLLNAALCDPGELAHRGLVAEVALLEEELALCFYECRGQGEERLRLRRLQVRLQSEPAASEQHHLLPMMGALLSEVTRRAVSTRALQLHATKMEKEAVEAGEAFRELAADQVGRETRLLGHCVDVLNAKKRRIRELEDELELATSADDGQRLQPHVAGAAEAGAAGAATSTTSSDEEEFAFPKTSSARTEEAQSKLAPTRSSRRAAAAGALAAAAATVPAPALLKRGSMSSGYSSKKKKMASQTTQLIASLRTSAEHDLFDDLV